MHVSLRLLDWDKRRLVGVPAGVEVQALAMLFGVTGACARRTCVGCDVSMTLVIRGDRPAPKNYDPMIRD